MVLEYGQHLKTAVNEYLLQNLLELPSEADLAASQSFSQQFERRMRRLIRRAEKMEALRLRGSGAARQVSATRPALTRKRLLLAAIVLSILVSVFSVTAAREAIVNFFVRAYDSFTTVIFGDNPGESGSPADALPSSPADATHLIPAFLPAGYALSDQMISTDMIQLIFRNPDGEEIFLERQRTTKMQMILDTEGVQLEYVLVRKTEGLYYANRGIQNLIWQEGVYAWTIFGKIDKDNLLNMAESINP